MKPHSRLSSTFTFGLFAISILLCLFVNPVACGSDDEDDLLQGLNSYRTSVGLTPLAKNDHAGCLADEIADQLEDNPCVATTKANAIPGTGPQLSNYQNMLSKCNVHVNNTRDGVILPVCVHNRVPTLVLTNYTRTGYASYLNDSRFTGAGVGKEDDWMVVILTTSTQQGSFASGSSLSCPTNIGFGLMCLAILSVMILKGH